MKVTINNLPNGTHMIYIIDEVSNRPIKGKPAKSLQEAETIQKEFEQIVASME
tara:strand:- start:543 stop:701 length:159 start_codon:yes stop_codon:yes gene_type:complete